MLQASPQHQPSDVTHAGRVIAMIEPNEVVRRGFTAMLRDLERVSRVIAVAPSDDSLKVLCDSAPDTVMVSCDLEPEELDLLQAHALRAGMKILLLLHTIDDPRLPEFAQRFTHGLIPLEDVTVDFMRDTLNLLDRNVEVMLPAHLTRRILQRPQHRQQPGLWYRNSLTQRELDVLGLVAQGYSNKQIAPRMCISEHGVKRHVANILAKLNCSNRTQAVSLALQENILQDPRLSAA